MPWVNYHSHSLFCDGKAAPEEYVHAAIEKNFPAWGFSSHGPVPFPTVWNMKAERLDEYISVIAALRDQYKEEIEVYGGLELDYIEGRAPYKVADLKSKGLDFIIGSVHYFSHYPDGTAFCFDGKPEAFFQGLETVYRNDFRKAVMDYFSRVRTMLGENTPDIIGHFDKIKMHSTIRPYVDEHENWYRKEIEDSLDVAKEKGCILEANTRGLYKHDPPLLYPSAWILKRALEKDIPVMMNADAHLPSDADKGFEAAAEILMGLGFKTLRVILDGRYTDRPFDRSGLL
jgi:histidinol-phosphatase (PHP family)